MQTEQAALKTWATANNIPAQYLGFVYGGGMGMGFGYGYSPYYTYGYSPYFDLGYGYGISGYGYSPYYGIGGYGYLPSYGYGYSGYGGYGSGRGAAGQRSRPTYANGENPVVNRAIRSNLPSQTPDIIRGNAAQGRVVNGVMQRNADGSAARAVRDSMPQQQDPIYNRAPQSVGTSNNSGGSSSSGSSSGGGASSGGGGGGGGRPVRP